MNVLTICFKSNPYNGYPKAKISLNDNFITEILEQNEQNIDIVLNDDKENVLTIERYGKTNENFLYTDNKILADQILEITNIFVDNIPIPDYIIRDNCKFEYDNNKDIGSLYFGPNGKWSFAFQTPIITWILDQKIIHLAKYDDSFKYPWSYKFEPNGPQKIIDKINEVQNKVNTIL